MNVCLFALVILFSRTSAGVVRQAPDDTLVLDNGQKIVGTAMPTKTILVPGDATGDGVVNSADIVFTVNQVFGAVKLKPPTQAKDTSNMQVLLPNGTIYNFSRKTVRP